MLYLVPEGGTERGSEAVEVMEDGDGDAGGPDQRADDDDAQLRAAEVVRDDWSEAAEVLDGHEHEGEDGDEQTGERGEPLEVADGLVVGGARHDRHHRRRQHEDGDAEVRQRQAHQVAVAAHLERVDHRDRADDEDAAHGACSEKTVIKDLIRNLNLKTGN